MDSESLQYTKSTMEQLLLMEKLSKGVMFGRKRANESTNITLWD